MTPQVEFLPSQVKHLRDTYKDLFDMPFVGNDAKTLGEATAAAFDRLRDEVRDLLAKEHSFPFLSVLQEFGVLLDTVIRKPAGWYLTDLPAVEEKLLDGKEQVLDPIRSFMGGQQRAIYEDVSRFLAAQSANFAQVGQAEADALHRTLADPNCYRGTAIQGLKARYLELKNSLDLKLIEERKAVEADIADCKTKVEGLPDVGNLTNDQRSAILARIEQARQGLTGITLIAVLRNRASEIRSTLYPALVEEVARLARPAAPVISTPGPDEPRAPVLKPPQFLKLQDIRLSQGKLILSTDGDVDAYVEELRGAMLVHIRAGKEIIV